MKYKTEDPLLCLKEFFLPYNLLINFHMEALDDHLCNVWIGHENAVFDQIPKRLRQPLEHSLRHHVEPVQVQVKPVWDAESFVDLVYQVSCMAEPPVIAAGGQCFAFCKAPEDGGDDKHLDLTLRQRHNCTLSPHVRYVFCGGCFLWYVLHGDSNTRIQVLHHNLPKDSQQS